MNDLQNPPNAADRRALAWPWTASGAILLVIGAWFFWQLLTPSAPIVVSKETTYITEPLLPSGLPDYRKYVLDKLRDRITPENNAAVVLWQAMGPGTGGDSLKEEEWDALQKELQLPIADKSIDYLPPIYCRANRRAIAAWLHQQDRLRAAESVPSEAAIQEVIHSDSWPLHEEGAHKLFDFVETYIDAAIDAPWSTDQLPPIAAWLEKHQPQLDLLVAGSERAKLYSPDPDSLAADGQVLLLTMSLESIQRIREIARVLSARAMWLLAEGQYEKAWDNFLAIHRWARLAASQRTITSQLAAIAIDGIASDGTVNLLADRKLPPALAKRIQRDLDSLTPIADMGTSFDVLERFCFLDAIIALRQEGAGSLLREFGGTLSQAPWLGVLDYVTIDWKVVLIEINQWHDRFAAASRIENWKAKEQELTRIGEDLDALDASVKAPGKWVASTFSRTTRSELLAAATINQWLSPVSACLTIEDRAMTELDLTRLAAALAVYRAENGEYPERLDQLVPDVISTLPVDLFHDKPFVYHRDGDGYLLYSFGPNGIDDGGSNERYGGILAGREIGWDDDDPTTELRDQIPTGADDISIRLPRPPFKLPEPPAADP